MKKTPRKNSVENFSHKSDIQHLQKSPLNIKKDTKILNVENPPPRKDNSNKNLLDIAKDLENERESAIPREGGNS